MKNRNPRLELSIIPINGTDPSIQCSSCPAACCREGMILPLSGAEAEHLREAGTDLAPLSKEETEGRRAPFRRRFYRLDSACGNLAINAVTSEAMCDAYDSPDRPRICDEFTMGGFACAQTQLWRIETGQDERGDAQQTS